MIVFSIDNLIEEKFWDPEDLIRYRLLRLLDRREIERIDSYDIVNTNEKREKINEIEEQRMGY